MVKLQTQTTVVILRITLIRRCLKAKIHRATIFLKIQIVWYFAEIQRLTYLTFFKTQRANITFYQREEKLQLKYF